MSIFEDIKKYFKRRNITVRSDWINIKFAKGRSVNILLSNGVIRLHAGISTEQYQFQKQYKDLVGYKSDAVIKRIKQIIEEIELYPFILGEDVKFKDGSINAGKLVGVNNGKYLVRTCKGSYTIRRKQLIKILVRNEMENED